jgi:hypothetical protein
MVVFWDVAPRSLVDTYTMMMEAVQSSETSVTTYHTTRCNIVLESHLYSKQYRI